MDNNEASKAEDILTGITSLIQPETSPQSVYQRVKEVIETPKGQKLCLRLYRKDDSTFVICQGLLSNIWGRITNNKLYSYNARLTRLLEADPTTRGLLEG